MKSTRIALLLALFSRSSSLVCIAPAYGANKDIIELQTQVTQLQQQMTQMKQSFDERMGVMKNLLEQNTDAANKVTTAINDLQSSINKQQQDRAGASRPDLRPDSSAERHHGRTQGPPRQAEQAIRGYASGPAIPGRAAGQAQQQAQAMAQAPPPDVLYNNALRDYNGGKNDLAVQEFNDYIKFYPNTDLAGNHTSIWPKFSSRPAITRKQSRTTIWSCRISPAETRLPPRNSRKDIALLELGKEDEGTQELKHVIQRYPRTTEATQARERLRKWPAVPASCRSR